VAEILSKSQFAALLAVNPAAVSNWIRRQRLTPPAVRPRILDPVLIISLRTQPLPYSAALPSRERQELGSRIPFYLCSQVFTEAVTAGGIQGVSFKPRIAQLHPYRGASPLPA
jgi:hypothetical protein